VEQVGEDRLAEGIVAEILDDASAIRVRTGLAELRGSEVREAPEQERLNGAVPGDVDDLFVGEDGVSSAGRDDATRKSRMRIAERQNLDSIAIGLCSWMPRGDQASGCKALVRLPPAAARRSSAWLRGSESSCMAMATFTESASISSRVAA